MAERATSELISLPMFPDLGIAQVDHVADALASRSRRAGLMPRRGRRNRRAELGVACIATVDRTI